MFGEAGHVLQQSELTSVALDFANSGLSRQLDSGENPEMGGGDVSYQMAGLFYAMRYYPYAPADAKARLQNMIRAGIEWDLKFISPDGTVSMGGSTRVGIEKTMGTVKGADLPTIFRTLAYANIIMPNERWATVATAVARNAKLPL
jgi:hypothetical protein